MNDMKRDTKRRLALIEARLQLGGVVRGEELQQIVGRNGRTVYRYISALRSRGLRILSDAGWGGGYMLAKEHRE